MLSTSLRITTRTPFQGITQSLYHSHHMFMTFAPFSNRFSLRMDGGRVPLIAGNWKMNTDLKSAVTLATELASLTKTLDSSKVEIAVVPPFPFLTEVSKVRFLLLNSKENFCQNAVFCNRTTVFLSFSFLKFRHFVLSCYFVHSFNVDGIYSHLKINVLGTFRFIHRGRSPNFLPRGKGSIYWGNFRWNDRIVWLQILLGRTLR